MKVFIRYIKKYKKEFVVLFILTLLISGITYFLPLVSQAIFDQGILNSDIGLIILYSSLTVILYIAKGRISYKYEVKISTTANEVVMLEKNEIFNNIIKMPLSFFDKFSPQYILSRINEVNNISGLISSSVFNFATNVLSALFALLFVLYKNFVLGIVCIIFMVILYKVTGIYMGQMGMTSRGLYEQTAKTNHHIHNAIQGLFTIKNLNREVSVQKDIEKDIKNLAKRNVQQQSLISKGTQITTATIYGINAILIGMIAILVVCKRLALADYISLSQYIALIFAPITTLQSLKLTTKPAIIALERVDDLLHTETTAEKDGDISIQEIESISVKHLSFSYDRNGNNVLKDVSIDLKDGEKLALIGSNGSGKTTFIKLLLGYYVTKEKQILINGTDLNKINKSSLRKCVGLVPQNIFLFEVSIYENIRIGNTDMEINQFNEKLKQIQEYGLLHGMDLNTTIIDNGKNLSKGQIQQIAITRTLMKEHSVYIFDEATSYLDKETKNAVFSFVKDKLKKGICIFICHNNEFDTFVNKELKLEH